MDIIFNLMKYLLPVFLVLVATLALSPEPIPTCTGPRFQPNDIPVSLNEVQLYNLDDYFTGFNLEFNLSSSAPDFVRLKQKTEVVRNFNKTQPGLKSYHLDHNGNEWGKNLITLSEQGWATKIRWGSASANQTIPDLTEMVQVQNQKNIWCFDAIWVRDAHVAIVDCVKSDLFGLQNVFIYVNTTSQVVLPKTFQNDMYVPYTRMTRRRMVLLRENGYDYLIRSYFADAVDPKYAHNTYLEIMTFVDPFKPRTLKVMDRSYIHQDRLSITDFKLYMGNMYLLDFHSGVIIFDITSAQNILITGRYRTDSGFHRLGVFSSNLDNKVLFALATDHAIYEVDFSNQLRPQIITKYTLMSNSSVTSVWVNEQYVIAQVSANVTNATNGSTWYNSSIVFSRGTRTYLNAYEILQHNTSNVIIDFERSSGLVLVIEQGYSRVYRLNMPILSVWPTNPTTLNKQFKFVVQGLSVNTYTGRSLVCTFSMAFTVVNVNSMTLWPTGLKLPDVYYANFPGQLFIPLNRYILGPNVTYGVKQTQNPDMAAYWILQQNETIIHWQKQPSLGKITFLRQEQYDSLEETELWIYTQDTMNITHFVQCTAIPFTKDVRCRDNGYIQKVNYRINNLTAHRYDQYEGYHVHLVAIVYEQLPNEVFIYEAETHHQIVKPIIFSSQPYEGVVTNIEFVGHYLAILHRYTKEILFYDMKACVDHQQGECKEVYRIDSRMMNQLGVNYFAPMDIYISDFHPWVLFIQNMDRVIIISVTRTGVNLLAQVQSPGSKQPGFFKFKIAIAQDHLVIVNPPRTIQQHSLAELYTKKDAPFLKAYPTYNYTIPDKFDLDFSDQGNLVYITARDSNLPADHNAVILVYKTGIPAVASFYDVFNVFFNYDDMLIDATGVFGDYVSVAVGSMLVMFRQYEVPVLVFENSFTDFDFNLTYTNDPHEQHKYLSHSAVKVANYPQAIVPIDQKVKNQQFLTKQIQYKNDTKSYVFNDSHWFNGSVLYYELTGCTQCGKKLKVVNHVDHKRDFHASMDMDDYVFTPDGGIVQQFQSQIKMMHNGSIDQYVSFPSVHDGESCMHVTHNWMYQFAVAACQHGDQVYLYMTSLVNSKPFVNGPHVSSARRAASIQAQGDIFILVDVDEEPTRMNREGGVLIYALNHNINKPELFDELDIIDANDLLAAQGWTYGDQVYIGNAHLVWTNDSQVYRLAITELRNGLFFIDFKWRRGMKEIQVLKVQFLNLRQQLFNDHLPMPNVAFFEAVTVSNEYYDNLFGYWQTELIVTTRNFHIFQIDCHFDKTGTLLYHKISKVFYRYSYYETSNYVKTFDGYFAVVQKLPVVYEPFDWLNRQVLTVYDTRSRWRPFRDEKIKIGEEEVAASYMLGGFPLPKGRVTFDFNFTLRRNDTDPFRDIGLLVLNARQAVIRQFALHDHIQIQTTTGIKVSQKAKFVAVNDFNTYQLPLSIVVNNNDDDGDKTTGLPGWAIALIVIGSLAIAGLGGFVCWRLYLKKRAQSPEEAPIKKSLLEEEGQGQDQDQEGDDDDDDDDDDDEDDDDEEEGKKTQPVAVVQAPTADKVMSINRETISSVGDQQARDSVPGQVPTPDTQVKTQTKPETVQEPHEQKTQEQVKEQVKNQEGES